MQLRAERYSTYLLLLLSLLLYITLTYFTARPWSTILIAQYGALFLCFLLVCKKDGDPKLLFGAAILFRIALLFAVPNLSDDFYRFIWDGRLINNGINPFSEQPLYFLENPSLAPSNINQELYNKLNSNNFTIYPPVLQGVFWVATFLFPTNIYGSVVIMKLFILAAEIGSLLLLKKLLQIFKRPSGDLIFYSLNPLIILEFMGNIHFEAFMVFFLLLSIYLIHLGKSKLGAGAFALAVASKLNPLIFLPLLFKRLGWVGNLVFSSIVGVLTLILFTPLLGIDLYNGLSNSISLYFEKFEFNASIYYLVREVGYWIKGYNVIQIVGSYLALSTFILILSFSAWEWRRKVSTPVAFLFVYFIYMAFATIVHPWYITPLIAFCVLTPFRFPLLWSFLIFFTYLGYGFKGYSENLLIVSIEYLVLLSFIIWEVRQNRKTTDLSYV